MESARDDPRPVENAGAGPRRNLASHPLVSVPRPARQGSGREGEGSHEDPGDSGDPRQHRPDVVRLRASKVEALADDLHVELHAWTASSTQVLGDYHPAGRLPPRGHRGDGRWLVQRHR